MDKSMYLLELQKELKGLSENDRENALAYYGEYLDDALSAGQNDASSVLGSPHTLAAQIKADIAMGPLTAEPLPKTQGTSPAVSPSASAEELSKGHSVASMPGSYPAPQQSQQVSFPPPPPGYQQAPGYQQGQGYQQSSGYQQSQGYQQASQPQPQPGSKKTKKGGMGVVWTVMLGILAIPVGLPLAIVLMALIIAVLAILFAFLVSLAAIVLAFFVSGLVSVGAGISFFMSSFPVGLFYLGSGLALLGLSVIFGIAFWQLGRLSTKGVAKLFNSIRKKLTQKERVAQ